MGVRFWGAENPSTFPNTPVRLRGRVTEFGHARQRVRALRFAAAGLVLGGVLAAIAGSAAQVFGIDGGMAIALAAVLVPVVGGAIAGWLRPLPEAFLALELDRLLRLDERVTTALELVSHPSPRSPARPRGRLGRPDRAPSAGLSPQSSVLSTALAADQIEDAASCLSAIRPGAIYAFRPSRALLASMAVAVALAIAPWVLPWPTLLGGATPASLVTTTTNAQAARLETVARRLDTDPTALDRPTRAQLAAQLRAAANKLRGNGANAQQSTRDLLGSEQSVATSAPQTGEDASLTLARISDALASQEATQAAARALDQQNAAQAAAEMNQLAANLGQMNAQQQQQLANALQAASNAARSSDTSAARELQQAAEAAKNGNTSGLQQAGQALQQLGTASQAQRDVAQTQSELQASRDAITRASQTGLPQLSSSSSSTSSAGDPSDAASSAGSPDSAQNGDTPGGQPSGQQAQDQSGASASASGSSGPSTAGNQSNGQPGSEPGSGYGKGSTDHVGAPQDPAGLAQREVVVPSDSNVPPDSISASNQLQNGTGGTARVDYLNVLPDYKQKALDTVENNAVPTNLQQVVKGYFDSLAPK
jgi:hypothetical protein